LFGGSPSEYQVTPGCRYSSCFDSAPHAVTLYFRGVRPIGVSPYWLGDPGGDRCDSNEPLADRYSSRPTGHFVETKQRLSCSCAHYRVQPNAARQPQQSLSLRRATETAGLATLVEFVPLRRVGPSESTQRRLATPTTFRPQGFSPSRRFTPRSNARPCFMPVTPLGFLPSRGFPPLPGLSGSSPVRLPSWCLFSAMRSKLRTTERPLLRKPGTWAYVTSL